MSTILKALRRLEQEREAKVERDLRDQVVARPEGASGSEARLRIPLLVSAGAVGAVLVVALVAFLERGGPEPAPAPALAASAPVARPAPSIPRARARVAPAPVPDAAARAAERQAQRAPVAMEPPAPRAPVAMEPPAPRAPVASEPLAQRAAASEPPAPIASEPRALPRRTAVIAARPPAASLPQVAAAARPEPPTPAAPRAPAPVAPVAPAPVAAAAPAIVSTVPTKPPFQEEPAPLAHESAGIAGQPEVAARSPVPGLVVERTLWHPDPGRRLAVLQVEGRDGPVELREGDAVGDLVVQQIDPSGVLFLHRGVEIRRRVGARD